MSDQMPIEVFLGAEGLNSESEGLKMVLLLPILSWINVKKTLIKKG